MSDSSAREARRAQLQEEADATGPRRSGDASGAAPAAEGAGGRSSYQRRVTLLQCMLNTNESNGGAYAVGELHRFATEVLFTERALERVILSAAVDKKASARRIRAVDIRAAGIEIGPHQKRVHLHWVMKITHASLQLNVGRMQRAIQDLTREHTPFQSPYCHIILLNAKPENYVLKEVYDEYSSSESKSSNVEEESV